MLEDEICWTLEAKLRRQVYNVVADCMGLDLNEDQIEEVLSNSFLRKSCEKWGVYETTTRDAIVDFLCKKVMDGRPWPTYGDPPKDLEPFLHEFSEKAVKLGYHLV